MDVFSPQLDLTVKRLTKLIPQARCHAFHMDDIYATRRRNFEAQLRLPPLANLPRKKDWAVTLNLSASMLSQVLRPDYRIGDDLARDIERQLNLKPNSLDMSGTSQSVRTNRQRMRDAMKLLADLAELQGVPALATDPDAVSIAYDFLVEEDSPLTENNVLDLTKRLAAKIRGDKDNGERSKTA